MTRLLLTLSLLLLSAQVPVLSQDDWFGDLQRFGVPISAGAPQGYQVARRPGGPVDPARTESAPAEITEVGFVERGGTRYYLTEEGSDQWIDNGNPSYWLVIPGAVFPEKPPLSSRQKGIDPDSGENVTIEVYEETVALVQTTAWPMAQPEYPDVVLPVKVKSIQPTTGDAWRATFTVYPSFDSNIDKYAFPYPSSNQMSDPAFQVLRKLVSKPSFKEITVTGTARAEQMMTVLKPGIVFNGLFAGGEALLPRGWRHLASHRSGFPPFRAPVPEPDRTEDLSLSHHDHRWRTHSHRGDARQDHRSRLHPVCSHRQDGPSLRRSDRVAQVVDGGMGDRDPL